MASTDEASALKRNSVHQTRLSMELQQLEKDRAIRLREMQKASQVFAKRHEQIQGKRDKASLKRVTSAPIQNLPNTQRRTKPESSDNSAVQPFISKLGTNESSTRKRQLRKTATVPELYARSNSLSTPSNDIEPTFHRRMLQKRDEKEQSNSVFPTGSRNVRTPVSRHDDLRENTALNQANPLGSSYVNRRRSVPCDKKRQTNDTTAKI